MPVADMLRYVELTRAGDSTVDERRELLTAQREEVRQKIADLRATLAVLDYKIDRYSGMSPSATQTKRKKQSA
jgi:hypothetical protein